MTSIKNFLCPRCNKKNDLILVKKSKKFNEFKCPTCSLKVKFNNRDRL